LRDIGKHFPSNDPAYKDADSLVLLAKVIKLLQKNGWAEVVNVDATVIAEKPRMADHIDIMVQNLSGMLGIDPDRVNVKATTTEGVGFVGRQEGIAASAVCLIARHE